MGKDAVVSCLISMLHPSEHIRNKYPNPTHQQRLENCTVLRQEVKKIRRQDRMAIVVKNDDFRDADGNHIELYGCQRWFKITTEGPSDFFFTNPEEDEAEGDEDALENDICPAELSATIGRFDTANLMAALPQGVGVDDDTQPAPENVPSPDDTNNTDMFGEWGYDGICNRRQSDANNTKARLKNFPNDVTPTRRQLFELLFPKQFVMETMLPETNKKLETPLDYGEFLRWIGLWFLMSTTHCENRRDLWSTEPISEFEGAPYRFGKWMSRNRFEEILGALSFTKNTPPATVDRFWEIREIVDAWNENMDDSFVCSWISCLDESMSKWLGEYTCPGFMVVPRKPWKFGNEWHTIGCRESEVIFRIELVEGKDQPSTHVKQFSNLGKTVGLLLRLTKPLWGSSKVVILDSGFCVLQAIIELRKKGVFASALIKKRRYWPKHIRGDDIKAHFDDKEVGSVDTWPSVMDGIKFGVYCLKEPDYVMSLMSTYGTNERGGKEQIRNFEENGQKRRRTFHYPETIRNHFKYRDVVDNHNATRMFPIALEETWKTRRWPNRVFQFLLAVTEVNAQRSYFRIFKQPEVSEMSFRKSLAFELINNPYIEREGATPRRSPRSMGAVAHSLVTLPHYRGLKPDGSLKVVGTKFLQRHCFCRNKRIRTYCSCNNGIMYCVDCHFEHRLSVATTP